MTGSKQRRELQLRNQTPYLAYIRFRCGLHLAWEISIPMRGGICVPNPRQSNLETAAVFFDIAKNVTYTASAGLPRNCGGMIAKMTTEYHLPCFILEPEAGGKAGEIFLENLTRGDVSFVLSFMETPFRISLAIAPGKKQNLALHDLNFSVTVNGYTTAPFFIKTWSEQISIEIDYLGGDEIPRLVCASGGYEEEL
jgi:hypothetical protein